MLKLYHQNSGKFIDQVKHKLREMVVAHKLVCVEDPGSLPSTIQQDDLPALSNGNQVLKSKREINNYLEELHQEMLLGQRMQSDSCHLDPDNPEECL